MKNILVVEDDGNLAKVLSLILQDEGYSVTVCTSMKESERKLTSDLFDLVVLDIELPDGNGFDLFADVLAPKAIPVVFLSSRSTESDRILGLKLGADDYVTKPFSTQELLLRIARSLQRHSAKPSATSQMNKINQMRTDLIVDENAYEVTYKSTKIDFTPTEVKIISLFIKYPRRVCTREFLMNSLPGDRLETADRSIDAHIKRIRRKFRVHNIDPIKTIRGVGYKYEIG
jgi:DNA-binding response OmpR family regulator